MLSRLAGFPRPLVFGTLKYLGLFALWWSSELSTFVPGTLRQYLVGSGEALRIRLLGEKVLAVCGTPEVQDTLLELSDEVALPVALRRAIGRADSVSLVVPRSWVLRRIVRLPDAARRDVRSAVGFLVEAETPFRLSGSRYDFRVLANSEDRSYFKLELVVMAGSRCDAATTWLSDRGVRVDSIKIEDDDATPNLDLLQTRRSGRWRVSAWKPWQIVLLASFAVAIGGPLVVAAQLHGQVATLAAAVSAASGRLRAVHAAEAAADSLAGAAALVRSKTQSVRAVEVLAILAEILPDQTWLFHLELDREGLRIEGFSGDVPGLIEHLQGVAAFSSPDYLGPVVHDSNKNRDRFDIRVRLAEIHR